MPSNEQTHGSDKTDSKKRPAKPAPENPDLLAQTRIHPATIVQRTEFTPHTVTPGDVLQLQQTLGNQAVQRLLASHNIQAKLIVGAAGDAYEQQADQVADQVIQPTHTSQLAAQNSGHTSLPEITRKSAPSSSAPNQGFAVGEKLEQVIQNQRGNGRPLPGELRQEMEIKMGADFSDVRLHTNNAAAQLNRRLAARAFTQGKDIYLDSGEHDPSSQEGKRLLAHELTHVIQQTGKLLSPVRAQEQNIASRPASTGVVQRDPDDEKKKAAPAASASASMYNVWQDSVSAPAVPAPAEEAFDAISVPAAAPVPAVSAGVPALAGSMPHSPDADMLPAGPPILANTKPKGSKALAALRNRKSDLAINLAKTTGYIDSATGKIEGAESHPAPIKLSEKFKDEDKKVGWRAFQNIREDEPDIRKERRKARSKDTDIVTRYYPDSERERNKLTPAMTRPLAMTRGGEPEDRNLYAMGTSGQAVLGPDLRSGTIREGGVERRLHHSSIFAGGDVAHAGHIATDKGKVTYMDDDSGHYRPDAAHTWDAYLRFKEQGQLSEQGQVSMVPKGIAKGVDQANYEAGKMSLRFSQYEQTGGNEEQARNKNAMLKQLLEKTAKRRADADKGAITIDKAALAPPLFRDDNTADKGYVYE